MKATTPTNVSKRFITLTFTDDYNLHVSVFHLVNRSRLLLIIQGIWQNVFSSRAAEEFIKVIPD